VLVSCINYLQSVETGTAILIPVTLQNFDRFLWSVAHLATARLKDHYVLRMFLPIFVDAAAFPKSLDRRCGSFLADRTNGRAYATVFRLSVVCDVMYCG